MAGDVEILFLVILEPRKAGIVRTAALGLGTRQLLEPIRFVVIAAAAVRRLANHKRLVVGLRKGIVEALVRVGERDAAGGVDVDADDVHRVGPWPPRGE